MKENVNYIAPIFKLSQQDPSIAPAKISYSQWSMYEKCPKQWELAYIKKLAPFTHSIETTFGTAFHETIQEYITILLTKGVKQADWMNFRNTLTENLKSEYVKAFEQTGDHFSNKHELGEYLEDGVTILDWFQKRRREYFTTKNTELIGVEIDLCIQASEKNSSVYWYGFIDLVIRNTVLNL